MSFRNRPVLDRKHRPRWQDELRTQQLIVGGFALAIAAAIGIFAATQWFAYYDGHLRPVATVGEVSYDMDDLQRRIDIIGSELQARGLDVAAQVVGGIRDPALQQGLQAIQAAIDQVDTTAADSLVTDRVLENEAGRFGIKVTSAETGAEVTRRQTLPERLRLSVIAVYALPDDAKSTDRPTDADWARAKADIDTIAAQLKGGADFLTVAKEKSKDASASVGGSLGWIQADDPVYDAYFTEAHEAKAGDLLQPTKDGSGYHLLRLDDRKAEGPDTYLADALHANGVSEAAYATYVRGELLNTAFRNHFSTSVVTRYQAQWKVSQIFVAKPQTPVVPQRHLRHFLAQPLPGEQDQSKATAGQWNEALARAVAFRAEASKPDADWWTIAAASDDTGSAANGGDLGWYDEASSQFVAEFKAAVAKLKVGEISEPVKTQFGYHVIEVTRERGTPGAEAETLLAEVRADPDQFAKLARDQSEDRTTAGKGGDLGWVVRYQLDTQRSDWIRKLTTKGQISDLLETTSGYYIFKLDDIAPIRLLSVTQLDNVRQVGVTRWLQEIRDGASTWVDPRYAVAPATA